MDVYLFRIANQAESQIKINMAIKPEVLTKGKESGKIPMD